MLRQLVTLACVAALLLPAATSLAAQEAGQDEVRDQLGDVQERLREQQDEIGEIDQRRRITLGDIERIDAEIATLDANLAALRAELAGAESDLEAAEQRLAATTSTLASTEQRLAETRTILREQRELFAGRTRASFMHGGATSMIGVTLDAGDIAQFGRALTYVERVMASDRDRVHRIAGLAREIEADTVELGVLRERQTAERAEAERDRDRVAGLVAEEQALRADAEQERENRQVLLAQLDANRETHLQMVAQLEEDSQRLEEELRRLAEEERRRQEEERRRQEEERRLAEEQRQQRERQAASRSSQEQSSAPAAAPPASSGQMQRPAQGRVTSGYGWRTHPIFGTRRLHAGVDFGGGYGAPIHAAEAGVVVSAGNRGGYGLAVVIDHGGGLTTLYAHQSRFAVSAGERVARGQVLGYVGSTGFSTGPHLHFEVRVNGATRNPMDYL